MQIILGIRIEHRKKPALSQRYMCPKMGAVKLKLQYPPSTSKR
jgi:hypothetical protein